MKQWCALYVFLYSYQWYLCWPDHVMTLHWRHNDHDGVSNHQPHGCLLNRLFRRRSKKTSKLRATGLCVGNSPEPVNSPHKGPAALKMLAFDDVFMKNDRRVLVNSHGIECVKSKIHTCTVWLFQQNLRAYIITHFTIWTSRSCVYILNMGPDVI